MNIPEFACGVLFTLSAEFIIILILAVYLAVNDKKKGGKSDAEKNAPIPTTTYDSGGKWYDGTC